MSTLHAYGPLLLASRLRKVSEALYQGVDEVYRSRGTELPSSSFPILFLLRDHGRLGISELARRLGLSHPAISQLSQKLLAAGVVREWPDPDDDRRRLLSLAPAGRALMRRLEPVWRAIVAAVDRLGAGSAISAALTEIDHELEQRCFAARIRSHLLRAGEVQIVPFEARYAADFKRLNLEWLNRYFRVERIDHKVLSAPQRILQQGGVILLARCGTQIVGTCCLLSAGEGRMELSKMAVTSAYQGLGLGRLLLQAALKAYASLGARELYLETNSVLRTAIALYESVGFVHTPRPGASHYERGDVYMVYRGA